MEQRDDSSGGGDGHFHWINILCNKSSSALDLIVLLLRFFLSFVFRYYLFVGLVAYSKIS